MMSSTMGGQQSEPEKVQYSMRLMTPRVNNCIKVFKIDLERLQQHKANIVKFQTSADWESLQREHLTAALTIQKLKSNLNQLEQLRAQVKEEDLEKFSEKIAPLQTQTQEEITEFLALRDNARAKPTTPEASDDTNEDQQDTDGSLSLQKQLVLDPVDPNVEKSWENLESNVTELNGLMAEFSKVVHSQQETVDTIEDNVTSAEESVSQGTALLAQAANLKSVAFPVMGALVGGALGGPLGFLGGMKVGALAAVGGSVAGYTGGQFMKNKQQCSVEADEAMRLEQREQQDASIQAQEDELLPDPYS